MEKPTSTLPQAKAPKRAQASRNSGALRVMALVMPWMAVDAPGMPIFGSTRVSKLSCARTRPPEMATAAIWTSDALAVSSPVVSVSTANASSTASGVAPLVIFMRHLPEGVITTSRRFLVDPDHGGRQRVENRPADFSAGRFYRVVSAGLLGARDRGHQRRDAPDRDATVLTRRTVGCDLQVPFAVALGDEVLRRHVETCAKCDRGPNASGFCGCPRSPPLQRVEIEPGPLPSR